jgi:hypothetical protein
MRYPKGVMHSMNQSCCGDTDVATAMPGLRTPALSAISPETYGAMMSTFTSNA